MSDESTEPAKEEDCGCSTPDCCPTGDGAGASCCGTGPTSKIRLIIVLIIVAAAVAVAAHSVMKGSDDACGDSAMTNECASG